MGKELLLLNDLGEAKPYQVSQAIESLAFPGVMEVCPAWDSVGVYVQPGQFDADRFFESLPTEWSSRPSAGKVHRVPVCFSLGEDWENVQAACSLPKEEVVRLLTEHPLECRAIGFCPGFPYLGPLPEALRPAGRRSQPRARVPAGSVAIAGGQAGIYPTEKPGGWNLIGRTPFSIMDVENNWFPIAPGDLVWFTEINEEEFSLRIGTRLPTE